MVNRIAEIRVAKKITQLQLAQEVGIARTYLSDIERGRKTPSGDIVLRIANALRMPVEDIFFTNDVNHSDQPAVIDRTA